MTLAVQTDTCEYMLPVTLGAMFHPVRPACLPYPSPRDVIPHHIDAKEGPTVLEYVTRPKHPCDGNQESTLHGAQYPGLADASSPARRCDDHGCVIESTVPPKTCFSRRFHWGYPYGTGIRYSCTQQKDCVKAANFLQCRVLIGLNQFNSRHTCKGSHPHQTPFVQGQFFSTYSFTIPPRHQHLNNTGSSSLE